MKNLLLIFTVFIFLVLGCGSQKNSGTSTATTEPTKATSPTTATPGVTVDPKSVVSDIKWKDFDAVFNVRSKTTDMQKESAWKSYEGKRVQWTGTVEEVSKGSFSGLTLNVKMNKETLTYDVGVYLKTSEEGKASSLTKGNTVTFAGTLKSYGGAILPTTLEDGEIK